GFWLEAEPEFSLSLRMLNRLSSIGRQVKQAAEPLRRLMGADRVLQKDICWPIWVVGLLGYAILAWWAIGATTKGENSVPMKLGSAAQAALDRAGVTWAQVTMDGQVANVSGFAPSEAAREMAKNVVKSSVWSGGFFSGGITKTHDRMALSTAPDAGVRWSAKRRPDGAIVLAGAAPPITERTELLESARAMFSEPVVDSMSATKGGAQSRWAGAARLGLKLMSDMPDGEAELSGTRLTVRGTAPNETFAQDALAQLRALPQPFTGESAIAVKLDIPELHGADLAANVGSVDECQGAFIKIMAVNTINFESGTATIGADNQMILNKIAYVSKRCSRFKINVEGYTDSSGARPANLALSKARADSVVAYLIAQGVSPQRLTAQGLGPDKPIASNDTQQGMAKNRRIEFSVRADGTQ
ncbi:MAG: OmpA family protein, partial [Caulobacterales bacterium]